MQVWTISNQTTLTRHVISQAGLVVHFSFYLLGIVSLALYNKHIKYITNILSYTLHEIILNCFNLSIKNWKKKIQKLKQWAKSSDPII